MNDALLELVLERLERVPLAAAASGLLLAACDSDESLAAELGGVPADCPRPSPGTPGAEPAGAYLRSVTVAGFRGIGPPATLTVEPGPGLAVIVGRNGSGKSSFAEALEVLLTGGLKRWEDLTAVWREGWRNMHVAGPAEIRADFVLEGAGPATVRRTWAAGVGFGDAEATVQVTSQKQADLDRLGWRDALVTHRPFLSHAELEAFFRKPSGLYKLLASVLGLEDLTEAEKRLSQARRDLESGVAEINRELPGLCDRLQRVDDERAEACRAALSGRSPDLEQARTIAISGAAASASTELGRLRMLSQLTIPPPEQVQEAVTAVVRAGEQLAATAGSDAGQAQALAGLLSRALDHYRSHGAGDCPVCGRAGALDAGWHVRTEEAVARLRVQATAATQAKASADEARAQAGRLILPVPAALDGPAVAGADPQAALAAWNTWLTSPRGDQVQDLADHLESAYEPLRAAVTSLVASARAELLEREDRWAPLAADVTNWCARAQAAQAAARPVPSLKLAVAWLRAATDDIRNDRLAPLAGQAREIWSMLRQESNVDLGAIRLSGSGNQVKVSLDVSVDGAPCAALGVMSQGEVNALALSVFLPRAMVAASPFRFLVIDDPVQAMDPAKVDGLARVLADVSRTRQVLVFTHDDRLPEAIRRLDIAAHVLEVTRRPGSVVEVRPGLDPVERQLKEAGALCRDEALPRNVAERIVPGLCRLAVEAAFTEAIRRRQLRRGRRHADVEADIEAADKLTKRAALAIFGNASDGAGVLRTVNGWDRRAADAYQAVNKGAHAGYPDSLGPLVTDTRRLTGLIRSKLP
jgi:hypothetical protein